MLPMQTSGPAAHQVIEFCLCYKKAALEIATPTIRTSNKEYLM